MRRDSTQTVEIIAFVAFNLLIAPSLACSTSLDCSLNGDCVDSVCVCDPAWSGSEDCAVLAVQPGPVDIAYHNATCVCD